MHPEHINHPTLAIGKNNRRTIGLIGRIALVGLPTVLGCSLMTVNPSPTSTQFSTQTSSPFPTDTIQSTLLSSPPLTATNSPSKDTPIPAATTVASGSSSTAQPGEGNFELLFDYNAADNPKASIDLDTMVIREDVLSDLQLVVSGGSQLFNMLRPVNGARGKSMGKDSVSLAECNNSVDSFGDFYIPELFSGNHLCVLSNLGRMVLLTVVETKGPNNGVTTIRLNYST